MSLDSGRDAKLREYWKDGLSASKIARKMGGFEHCADGGRSAILGQVKRHREAAQKAKNEEELKFWTRSRSTNGAGKRSGAIEGKKSRRVRDKPLSRKAREEFVDGVVVNKIQWPSDAEVTAKWAKDLAKAASKADV